MTTWTIKHTFLEDSSESLVSETFNMALLDCEKKFSVLDRDFWPSNEISVDNDGKFNNTEFVKMLTWGYVPLLLRAPGVSLMERHNAILGLTVRLLLVESLVIVQYMHL